MTLEEQLREALKRECGDAFTAWEERLVSVATPILQAAIAAARTKLSMATRIFNLHAASSQARATDRG